MKRRSYTRIAFILTATLAFVTAQMLYTYLPSIGTSKAYYWTRSLSYLVIAVVLRHFSNTHKEKAVGSFLCTLALNDFLDELFFNPLEFSWNEVVALVLAVLLAAKEYFKIKLKILFWKDK